MTLTEWIINRYKQDISFDILREDYDVFIEETDNSCSIKTYKDEIRRIERIVSLLGDIPTPTNIPKLEVVEDFENNTVTYKSTAENIHTIPEMVNYFKIDVSDLKPISAKTRISSCQHTTWNILEASYKKEESKPLTHEVIQDSIKHFLDNYNFKNFSFTKSNKTIQPGKRLVEILPFDYHFGKHGRPILDLDQYRSRYVDLVTGLGANGEALYDADEALLVNGGDYINIDNVQYSTTKGTPQLNVGTWQAIIDNATTALIESIENLKQIFKKVNFINVSGNHDRMITYALGVTLEKLYQDDNRVIIDNSHNTRKYFNYGDSTILFSHGDGKNENSKTFPLFMAQEAKQYWPKTKIAEAHVGHFHKGQGMDNKVNTEELYYTTRYFPSLSVTGQWEDVVGYAGIRQVQALIWDKKDCLIGDLYKQL